MKACIATKSLLCLALITLASAGFSDGGDLPNLILNGSFEGGDETQLHYRFLSASFEWLPGGWSGSAAGAGWALPGTWYPSGVGAKDGRAAAYLANNGFIRQSFVVGCAGSYNVEFYVIGRGNQFLNLDLVAKIDEGKLQEQSVISKTRIGYCNEWRKFSGTVELYTGTHELAFVGEKNGDDCAVAIDSVSITIAAPYSDRVTIEGDPSNVGTPSPGYGILNGLVAGEHRTFIAPAGVDAGDYTATCLGWKLFRYDAENDVWALSEQSGALNKTQCDYTHGAVPARLVWQWDVRVAVSATTAGSGTGTVSLSTASATPGAVVTCAAVPGGSSVFDHWEGDLPAGAERNPSLSIAAGYSGISLTAFFTAVEGSAQNIEYVGADGGEWNVASNWSPEKIPTALDSVTVDGKSVVCTGALVARSVTVTGGTGSLVVGDGAARLSVLVAGDFKVLDGASVRFKAGRTEGVAATNWVDSAVLLHAEANAGSVRIGGLLKVGAASTLYAENDALTGTPVFFRPRNFEIEEGGTVDASGLGFARFKKADWSSGGAPVGAVWCSNNYLNSSEETEWYSYAFGRGLSYRLGAGHGGIGKNETTQFSWPVKVVVDAYGNIGEESVNVYFGDEYGYRNAPFLPGSPNGVYGTSLQLRRGGGSVCVFATESATLNGAVRADAEGWGAGNGNGGASGGSVWIAARTLAVGRQAEVTARGGDSSASSTGAGGRIALTVGAVSAELDLFAAGQSPEGFTTTNMVEIASSVKGGNNDAWANPGTDSFAFAGARVVPTLVTADGAESATVTPAYGFNVFDRGNIPEFVCMSGSSAIYDVAYRNRKRSIPSGDVVFEDATGAIGSLEDAVGTAKAVWTGADEDSLRLKVVGDGTVTLNGSTYAADAEIWLPEGGAPATLTAVDGTGRFVRFVGDIPGGISYARTISVPVIPGMIVQAVFSDAVAVEKTFVGGDGAFWDADESWSPVGIPSAVDNVSVAGKVRCCNVLAAGSLSVTGGKVLVGGDVDGNKFHSGSTAFGDYVAGIGLSVAGNVEIGDDDGKIGVIVLGARLGTVKPYDAEIGGSLTLSGASEMTVHACPYPEDQYVGNRPVLTNFYHTAYKVKIGCELTLSDSSQLIPDCDILTGNPVCFDVGGNVTIGEAAKVNARMRGFGWVENEGTWSTTFGWTYMRGGVYAGLYAKSGISPFYTEAATCLYAAPYVPGAPCGQYSDYTKLTRGGGVVWIKTSRRIVLDGTIDASGGNRLVDVPGELSGTEGGSSGGGIWLVCSKLAAGPHATAYSYGGCCNNKDSTFGGSGGSVCVSMKVSDRNLALFAEGATDVRGCTVKSGVAFSTDVTGHSNAAGEAPPGPSGSATTVTGGDSKLCISIR